MEAVPVIVLQLLMGVGLAASAGLRAFLPLLAVGVAGRVGWVPLSDSFSWMSDWPALTVFGVAVIAEILSDKIPTVDHFLDMVQVFVKPVAGTVLVAAVITELSPLQTAVLAIVLGSGAAGTIHVVKAKTRVASSVVTAGFGNPFLSMAEDVTSLAGSLLSIFLPVVMGMALVFLFLFVYRQVKRGRIGIPGRPAGG
jgi:uncharacterized membrane protein